MRVEARRAKQVRVALRRLPGRAGTAADVARAAGEPADAVQRTLDRLAATGRVRLTLDGRYNLAG